MTDTPRIVFDANVLYGHLLRDVVLSLAERALFIPCWSERIQKEWVRHLKQRRLGDEARIDRTVNVMNQFFPDSLIPQTKVDKTQDGLAVTLPDPDDLHVLACAITVRAEFLVTSNLKHFPARLVATLGVRVLGPDAFFSELLRSHPTETHAGIKAMRGRYRQPPTSARELAERMEQVGLRTFAHGLSSHLHSF